MFGAQRDAKGIEEIIDSLFMYKAKLFTLDDELKTGLKKSKGMGIMAWLQDYGS